MIAAAKAYIAIGTLAVLLATNAYTARQLSAERKAHQSFRLEIAEADTLRSETARIAEAGHRARERAHAATLQAVTQKAAHEKTRLAADLQRTIDSLRNRPERPAVAAGGAVPSGASDPVGCTGERLARPDAEFLARYAADAARLQLEFDACATAYDAAVRLTN